MKDGIDLGAVQYHNSPNVSAWPATATITKLEFRQTGVHVEHTRNQGPSAWPNFRPAGWDGDLQFTLWIFLNIGGQWHGAGCIQFWQSCDQNGGPPEEFAKNWYYAADRWAPMTGHQPQKGETVGFMVSAGDARNDGAHSVDERSSIVAIPFPASGDIYLFPAGTPEPSPEPPTPLVPPTPVPTDDALAARVKLLEDTLGALINKVDALERKPEPVMPKQPTSWKGNGKGSASLAGFKIPISVDVVVDTPVIPEN